MTMTKDDQPTPQTPDDSFGHWTNIDERIEELNNRLAAWVLAGAQLPELFADALRRLVGKYGAYEVSLLAPPTVLLEAFEEALDSFDNILATFPEALADEDEGWAP